ncbi:MAG: tetratricopeptide repeat protein [Fidelibacterota bacterium]|nr:MAG: tetratricopeptide repeat protein [Candidatus Neomarinimicrobiota bacterium]
MPRLLIAILVAASINGQEPPEAQPDPADIPEDVIGVWQQYEKLLSEYPGHPILHYNFGNLAYGAGDYQKALEEYQAALKTDDREAQTRVLFNLGNSLFRAGKIEDSKSFYRKVLELNPDDQDARINYELAAQLAEQQSRQDIQSSAKDPNAEQEDSESSGQESSQEQSGQQQDQSQSEEQEDQSEQQQAQGEQSQDQPDEESTADAQQSQAEDEQQREEVEALLNALRANEDNLLKRTYRPQASVKLEKDW